MFIVAGIRCSDRPLGATHRPWCGGHSSSENVSPFNETWAASLVIIAVGAGAFLAIAVAWILVIANSRFKATSMSGLRRS